MLFNFICSLVITLLCTQCIEGELYRKCLLLDDPALNTYYAPLTNSSTNPPANSTIECAAQALAALYGKINSKRATAFVYSSANKTCQLGQTTVIYDDALNEMPTIVNGSAGVNCLTDVKPLASVAMQGLSQFYILNEQRLPCIFAGCTSWFSTDFQTAPDSTFNVLSPVQTLEGQYAWTPGSLSMGGTTNYISATAFTYNVWYNPGSKTWTSPDPLTNWYSVMSIQNVYLFAGYGNTPSFNVQLSLVPYSQATLNVFTVNGIVANEWVYLGVTYDSTSGHVILYMNGTAQLTRLCAEATNTTVGPAGMNQTMTGSNKAALSLMQYLIVGGSNGLPTVGSIASVEVYEYAMSASQMATAMEESTTVRVRTSNFFY